MDGHALGLDDDSFDVAGSQFGVMLFPDMPRMRARRVPRGRIGWPAERDAAVRPRPATPALVDQADFPRPVREVARLGPQSGVDAAAVRRCRLLQRGLC